MCIPYTYICFYFLFIELTHSSRHSYLEKCNKCSNLTTATLWPLNLLKLLMTHKYFLARQYLHNIIGFLHTQVNHQIHIDDIGLNCSQHQGWYECSKYIGMHPTAIKGYHTNRAIHKHCQAMWCLHQFTCHFSDVALARSHSKQNCLHDLKPSVSI